PRPATPTLYPYTTLFRSDRLSRLCAVPRHPQLSPHPRIFVTHPAMNIRIATLEDAEVLIPFVRAYHEFEGIRSTEPERARSVAPDRKSTRLNSSHVKSSY